jgi:hypothetical protein
MAPRSSPDPRAAADGTGRRVASPIEARILSTADSLAPARRFLPARRVAPCGFDRGAMESGRIESTGNSCGVARGDLPR